VASVLAVLVLGATGVLGPTDRSLQERVDAASPGEPLVLEPRTYAETVHIDKPFTIHGRGEVTIDGGIEAALEITTGPMHLENLTLTSSSVLVRVQHAGSVTFWQVDSPAKPAVHATDTRWVRTFEDARLGAGEHARGLLGLQPRLCERVLVAVHRARRRTRRRRQLGARDKVGGS
jgi:hypothetical protein